MRLGPTSYQSKLSAFRFSSQTSSASLANQANSKQATNELTIEDIKAFDKTPLEQIEFKQPYGKQITNLEKLQIKRRLLEVNRLLLARRRFANPSNVYNASLVEMEGNLWGRGVGAEGHQEFPVCAEKSAICDALTRQSESMMDSLDKVKEMPTQGIVNLPKVKRIFHAGDRLKPCGECLDWIHSGVFFDKNSEIIRLYQRQGEPKKWLVDIKPASELLPMNFSPTNSFSPYRVKFMELDISPDAKRVMADKKIDPQSLNKLMEKAQDSYVTFTTGTSMNLTPRTQQNMSASVMLDDGNASSSPYVEIRRGIQIQPDMAAFTAAMRKSVSALGRRARKVAAIAYFGQNTDFPRPSTLHGFSHRSWGSYDVLILTIANNQIRVRTIREYLQDDYDNYRTKLSSRRQLEQSVENKSVAEQDR